MLRSLFILSSFSGEEKAPRDFLSFPLFLYSPLIIQLLYLVSLLELYLSVPPPHEGKAWTNELLRHRTLYVGFFFDLLTDFAALCLTDFIDWRHSLVVGISDPACELLLP